MIDSHELQNRQVKGAANGKPDKSLTLADRIARARALRPMLPPMRASCQDCLRLGWQLGQDQTLAAIEAE